MQAPYIPARNVDFAAWLANFSTKLTAAPVTYGLLAGDAVIVAAVAATYAAAYAAATTPATRTSATIAAADAARAAAEATVRPYAVRISVNDGVSDANKILIGVNLPNATRTPVPAPATAPALNLVSAIIDQHTLGYHDTTTPMSKAKPFGATGLQIYRTVAAAAAPTPVDAALYAVITKSPTNLATDSADRGKVATYFGRWVTRSGPSGVAQVGPFGAPLAVTIL